MLLATIVTTITTVSMSAICTNGNSNLARFLGTQSVYGSTKILTG